MSQATGQHSSTAISSWPRGKGKTVCIHYTESNSRKSFKLISVAWCSLAVHQRPSAVHTPQVNANESDNTRNRMTSLGPLDAMDPNIPTRQPKGKLQAAQQPISRAPLPLDRNRSEANISEPATSGSRGLSPVTRPFLTGMPSFQRPRKRVIWRNKACFIALPLEDEFGRSTCRERYLSPDDFVRRLKDWENQGFNTNGFTLASQTSDSLTPTLEGQSRAVHPDPEDEKRERANGTYRVSIPDQRHWVCTTIARYAPGAMPYWCLGSARKLLTSKLYRKPMSITGKRTSCELWALTNRFQGTHQRYPL